MRGRSRPWDLRGYGPKGRPQEQAQCLIVISCRFLLNPRVAAGPQPARGREIPVVGYCAAGAAGVSGAGRRGNSRRW
jgi:hypothetical protein